MASLRAYLAWVLFVFGTVNVASLTMVHASGSKSVPPHATRSDSQSDAGYHQRSRLIIHPDRVFRPDVLLLVEMEVKAGMGLTEQPPVLVKVRPG
jgi:hypothetical protein